jgi:hypothetical protein
VDFYYTAETIIPLYISIAVLSLFFGFLGTMLVEVPFSKLEKMLFSIFLKKKDRTQVVTNAGSIVSGNDSILSNKASLVSKEGSILTNESLNEKLIIIEER